MEVPLVLTMEADEALDRKGILSMIPNKIGPHQKSHCINYLDYQVEWGSGDEVMGRSQILAK